MEDKIKQLIQKQQFNPGLLGVFINPFYFVRVELYKEISLLSKHLHGKLLDVGCGIKPYQKLFTNTSEYVGMEFDSYGNRTKGRGEVFYDGKIFPFQDNAFDSVI